MIVVKKITPQTPMIMENSNVSFNRSWSQREIRRQIGVQTTQRTHKDRSKYDRKAEKQKLNFRKWQ